jgi:chromosome segregation ATPase
MANITKTQIKKRLEELSIKLEDLQGDIEELNDEVNDEVNDIEPYEGKDDLTPDQEERQEWLEDLSSSLDDVISSLEDVDSTLQDNC